MDSEHLVCTGSSITHQSILETPWVFCLFVRLFVLFFKTNLKQPRLASKVSVLSGRTLNS